MKNRRITKKSLEDLAKVMPILTEREMNECVGGAVFLNKETGEKFGKLGPSSTIRVCTAEEYQYLSQMLSHELGSTEAIEFESQGTAFKDMGFSGSGNEGTRLMKKIVKREIGYTGAVVPVPDNEELYMAFSPGTDGIVQTFYFDPTTEWLNNYDTFMSILTHEKAHYGTGGGGSGNKPTLDHPSEDYAYNEQCSQPGFLSLPYEFRLLIAKKWRKCTTQRTNEYISQKTGIPVNYLIAITIQP